jgi:[ribosomal protein S18]-alanine N-acetyltransferase
LDPTAKASIDLKNSCSIIREAKVVDIDSIFQIEQKCFPESIAYSKRQLTYLLLEANSKSLVEYCNGIIRGFVIVTYRRDSLIGHIETIDVDPAYVKHGIGLKLLSCAEDEMRKKGKRWSQLEVSENNKAALKLYEKAGYVFKERIQQYYTYEHDGTRDALRLVKAL